MTKVTTSKCQGGIPAPVGAGLPATAAPTGRPGGYRRCPWSKGCSPRLPSRCRPQGAGSRGRLGPPPPARDEGGDGARGGEGARTERGVPVGSKGAAGPTASTSGGARGRDDRRGRRRAEASGVGTPRILRGKDCGVRGADPWAPGGRALLSPSRVPAAGLRSRSPTGVRPRARVGVRRREVCRVPWGSPPGPRLGPAAAAETAAGTARAQAEAGPAGCSEEGAGPGAAQNPLSSPRPALPFPGAAPAPWPRTRGARKSHGTRCLLGVGCRRQWREQGRAK